MIRLASLAESRMLSDPPEAMVPTTLSSPLSMVAVIRTTSASKRRKLGKAMGLRAFSEMKVP